MMKLYYIWANDDKIINSVGMQFSSEYLFELNRGVLRVNKNNIFTNYPYLEYEKIKSISGVIGRNGAGKSSLLKLVAQIIESKVEETSFIMVFGIDESNYILTNIADFDSRRIDLNDSEFRYERIVQDSEAFFENKSVAVVYYTSIIDYMSSISTEKVIDISTNDLLSLVKMGEKTIEEIQSKWASEAISYILSSNYDVEFLPIKSIKVNFAHDFFVQYLEISIATAFESILSPQSFEEDTESEKDKMAKIFRVNIIKIIREYIHIVCKGTTIRNDHEFVSAYATEFDTAYNLYLNNFVDYQSITENTDNEGDVSITNLNGVSGLVNFIDENSDMAVKITPENAEDINNLIDAIYDKVILYLAESDESMDYSGDDYGSVEENKDQIQELDELISEIKTETDAADIDSQRLLELLSDFLRLIPDATNYDDIAEINNDETVEIESATNISEVTVLVNTEELTSFQDAIKELDATVNELLECSEVFDLNLGSLDLDLRFQYNTLRDFYQKVNKVLEYFDHTDHDKNLVTYELPSFSTGEHYYYELMSRLMHVQEKSRDKDLIVLIDEGEVFLHPDAQRQFVEKLLIHLNRLDTRSINLIIASNSPFVISDLTRDRLTLIDSENNELERTFGANIHEILASDFFMDSTVGSLAYRKIIDLSNALGEDTTGNLSEYKKIIDSIGEDFIRVRLMQKLSKLEPSKKLLLEKILNTNDHTTLRRLSDVFETN